MRVCWCGIWLSFVAGGGRFLLTLKYFGKRSPRLKWLRPLGPISACAIAITAVVAGQLQDKGIRIVGSIPRGDFSLTFSGTLALAATWAAVLKSCLLHSAKGLHVL